MHTQVVDSLNATMECGFLCANGMIMIAISNQGSHM